MTVNDEAADDQLRALRDALQREVANRRSVEAKLKKAESAFCNLNDQLFLTLQQKNEAQIEIDALRAKLDLIRQDFRLTNEELERRLDELNKARAQQEATRQDLDDIRGRLGYKILHASWSLVDHLLPHGSLRRNIYDNLTKLVEHRRI